MLKVPVIQALFLAISVLAVSCKGAPAVAIDDTEWSFLVDLYYGGQETFLCTHFQKYSSKSLFEDCATSVGTDGKTAAEACPVSCKPSAAATCVKQTELCATNVSMHTGSVRDCQDCVNSHGMYFDEPFLADPDFDGTGVMQMKQVGFGCQATADSTDNYETPGITTYFCKAETAAEPAPADKAAAAPAPAPADVCNPTTPCEKVTTKSNCTQMTWPADNGANLADRDGTENFYVFDGEFYLSASYTFFESEVCTFGGSDHVYRGDCQHAALCAQEKKDKAAAAAAKVAEEKAAAAAASKVAEEKAAAAAAVKVAEEKAAAAAAVKVAEEKAAAAAAVKVAEEKAAAAAAAAAADKLAAKATATTIVTKKQVHACEKDFKKARNTHRDLRKALLNALKGKGN